MCWFFRNITILSLFPIIFIMVVGCSGGGSSDSAPVDPHKQIQARVTLDEPIEGMRIVPVAGQPDYIEVVDSDNSGNFSYDVDPAHFFGGQYYIVVLSCKEVCKEKYPKLQPLHALLTQEQMVAGGWEVNALSEAIYLASRYYIQSEYPTSEINNFMDKLAVHLLDADLNEDNVIDRKDFMDWQVDGGRDALRRPQVLDQFIQALIEGEDRFLPHQTLMGPVTGQIDLSGPVSDIVVEASTAVITWRKGVQRIDLSDPYELKRLDSYQDITQVYYRSWIDGEWIYLFNDTPRIDVLQASSTSTLNKVAELGASVMPGMLFAFSGDQVFTGGQSSEEPTGVFQGTLSATGLVQNTEYVTSERLLAMKVDGSRVYAAGVDTFYVREQGSGTIQWQSAVSLDQSEPATQMHIVVNEDVNSGRVYLASDAGVLYTLNIINSTDAYVEAQNVIGAAVINADISDNTLYLLTQDNSIYRYDISGNGIPQALEPLKNTVLEFSEFSGFVAHNDQLVLAGDNSTLLSVDPSSWETIPSPKITSLQVSDANFGGVYRDQTLYLASGEQGVDVIDVLNPKAPRKKGSILTTLSAHGIELYRDLLIIYSEDQLEIWNVDSLFAQAPEAERAHRFSSDIVGVSVVSNYAYVLTQNSGLHILNLSEEADIIGRIIRTVTLSSGRNYTGIVIHDDGYAYLSNEYAATGQIGPITLVRFSSFAVRGPSSVQFSGPVLDIYPHPDHGIGDFGICLSLEGLTFRRYGVSVTGRLIVVDSAHVVDSGQAKGIKLIDDQLIVMSDTGLRVKRISINSQSVPWVDDLVSITTMSPPVTVIDDPGNNSFYVTTERGELIVHQLPVN